MKGEAETSFKHQTDVHLCLWCGLGTHQFRANPACSEAVFFSLFVQRNARVEAGVAGYNVAEYIPSWREQQLVARDDTVEEEKEDSDGGGSASGAETSDEESLKALKDLFDDAGPTACSLVEMSF